MLIRRSNPDRNFTISPNEAMQDERLSYTARGVLASLISRPDGWQATADSMSRQATQHRGAKVGEGRRAMRLAFAELEELGYLVRVRTKGENGHFKTVMVLYDTSGHHRGTGSGTFVADFNTDDDLERTGDEGTATGTSITGTSISGTSLQSTDQERSDRETTGEKHSSTFADAHVAAARASADDHHAKLHANYQRVDRLAPNELSRALLGFERNRKRIFSECRHHALNQLEENKASNVLDTEDGVLAMNRLVLKYGVRHYSPDVPAWFVRLLDKGNSHVRLAS